MKKKKLSTSLTKTALNGAKWSGITNIGSYGISFFLSIILARLLDPSDFGLLGTLSIFTAISQVIINSGLSTALIRTKNICENDYTTVFYFNIFVSAIIYALLYYFSTYIALFYNENKLVGLTRLISLVLLINSFGIIQNTILIKKIDFKTQSFCNLTGIFISAIIASFMAFRGYGVYSIVSQSISQSLITTSLLWYTSSWRPCGNFSIVSFKKLWSFGSKILATSLVTRIIENVDNVLIGKVFSTTQLGFFVRAKSSVQIPQQIFSGILGSTSFAILSKVSENIEKLKSVHLKFYKIGTYFYIPIIFGFIAISNNFIIVLYSEKWLPSVTLFRIIASISITYFIGVLFSQTLLAASTGTKYFKITIGKKALVLLAIPFGLYLGIYKFAWALLVLNLSGLIIDFYFVGKLLSIKFKEYIIPLVNPIIMSAIMSLTVFFIAIPIQKHPIIALILQISLGILLYSIGSHLLKVNEYYYLKKLLKKQIFSFKHKILSFSNNKKS